MSKENRIFLEADETAYEKQFLLNPPQGSEDDFKYLFQSSDDKYPWKLVKPKPGFCVKTHKGNGSKVFINICYTDDLPAAEDINEAKLVQILESDDVSNFRVPMSIGEGREELDKSGNPATVYDIALNTDFFKKVENSKIFRSFILTAAMEGLQNKYHIEFQAGDYIILKNRKVMGTLQPHRIQQRGSKSKSKPPLIQEMSPRTSSRKVTKKDPVENVKPMKPEPILREVMSYREPEYKIICEPSGEKAEYLIGEFKVKDVQSVQELMLNIGEDRIVIESRKRGYLLDIFVPYTIDQEKTTADFDDALKVLTIKMPIISS